MTSELRRGRGLLLLLGFEMVGVWGLTELGTRSDLVIPWNNLGLWLQTAPPEVAVGAFVHKLALAAVSWLAMTTVGYVVAASRRAPSAIALFRAITLPCVRSAVDRALAVSLTAAVLSAPPSLAHAEQPPRDEPPPAASVLPPGTSGVGFRPVPRGKTEIGLTPRPPSAPPAAAATEDDDPRIHIVEPGDSLWRIASDDAAAHPGAAVDLASHWLRIVDLNRGRIRSGDPDLIYPGERILIPPF